MSANDTKKLTGLGADIEKTISKLLKEVMGANSEYSLTDKMKVVDRALKLEAIKAKMEDGEGAFFTAKEDEGADDE